MNGESPAERSLRARTAAHMRWAQTGDRRAATAPARAAGRTRFEKLVDPDGVLPEAERVQRAASARSAFYADMARKSAKARRERKAH